MQVKIKFSILLFFVACLVTFRVSAQEDVQTGAEMQELNHHPELNLNDDKTLLMLDADVRTPKSVQNPRETNPPPAPVVAPAKSKSESAAKPSSNEKTEEDPLSFNFLYFIIQKFKISDIVDD